jgi:hypothetical protein
MNAGLSGGGTDEAPRRSTPVCTEVDPLIWIKELIPPRYRL